MEIYTKYNYYINTREKSSGVPTDCLFNLPNAISLALAPYYGEFRLKVLRTIIPFSFNQINTSNYTTEYQITRATFPTTLGSFNMTPSNPSVNDFMINWIAQLQASITALPGYGAYTCPLILTYNPATNLINFSITFDGNITQIDFFNVLPYTQINACCGFLSAWQLSDTSILPDGNNSDVSINMSPSRALYITSNTLLGAKCYSALSSPMNTTNIIAQVPIFTQPFSYLVYEPSVPLEIILNVDNIVQIQLGLIDESINGEVADMFLDWSIVLELTHYVDYQRPVENHHDIAKLYDKPRAPNLELDSLMKERDQLKNEIWQLSNLSIDSNNANTNQTQTTAEAPNRYSASQEVFLP